MLATVALWQAIPSILTVLASMFYRGRPLDVLALHAPAGRRSVYLKALLLLAAMQIMVGAIQYTFFPQEVHADQRQLVRLFGDQWLLALLVAGIGAPLWEELLFRGFLLSALAQTRLGFAGGALVSTVVWTALHAGYSLVGIAEVFLIGLFLSWLLWRTGSLRVPIFCHALYNSFVVVALQLVPPPQ